MNSKDLLKTRFAQEAELPDQVEFIQTMESKVNGLLSSKLTGTFRMVVAPDGFHYGFKYGGDGYYNKNSLLDIDCTLETAPSQVRFPN